MKSVSCSTCCTFTAAGLAALLLAGDPVSADAVPQKPNKVYNLADDGRYGEGGRFHPSCGVPTRGLDCRAREGMCCADVHGTPAVHARIREVFCDRQADPAREDNLVNADEHGVMASVHTRATHAGVACPGTRCSRTGAPGRPSVSDRTERLSRRPLPLAVGPIV